jgi:hypothetical protein
MNPLSDLGGRSVLTLTSRFVLQVLPYLLMALAALVLLPGVAESLTTAHPGGPSFRLVAAMIEPSSQSETALDLIRQDHAAFAPLREIAKATEANLRNR